MPNTAAIATSFKPELLAGIHALGTTVARGGTGADALKAALYLNSANIGAGTTAYTAVGEAAGAGYAAGGIAVTNATPPTSSGTTGYWTPSASLSYTPVSVGPIDCVLLYNSTQANRAIASFTFAAVTIVAGTLTLTMPANAAGTALLQVN